MAFIQKWNDGKTEREKKREQMWNGILEKAGIKKGSQRTPLSGFIRYEIVVQQCFKRAEHALVLLFTGSTLSIIETNALVEQQPDGRSDNQVSVTVCLVAVSYTHLDVYKRQIEYSPSSAAHHCSVTAGQNAMRPARMAITASTAQAIVSTSSMLAWS